MKALEMAWPFVPEVHLFHDKGKCRRFIMREFGSIPSFLEAGAQTWYNDNVAVVLFDCKASPRAEDSLLCHEAVHVASMHYEYMGEDKPSEEFVAYGVQVVARALMEAHDKWKRKHVRAE